MRKVEDVSTRGGGPELEVHARPIETYVRPAEEPTAIVIHRLSIHFSIITTIFTAYPPYLCARVPG